MSCTVIAADRRFCFPTKIVLSVYFKIGNFKPITVFRCCTDCCTWVYLEDRSSHDVPYITKEQQFTMHYIIIKGY